MVPILTDLSVAIGLIALLIVAFEFGYRAARLSREEEESAGIDQIGAVQGAVLGLLGLLLAFSFAAAAGRFFERQDLIVQEANAIGTAFLRADLLDEPHRSDLRDALRRYTQHRVGISKRLQSGLYAAALADVDRLQAEIWRAAIAGVTARRDAALAVLNPVNDVIDLHSMRITASLKTLPPLVMGLLIASSALALGVIGYGSGVGGKRRAPLTVSLAILIGMALWITIDLEHPRAGLIQLSDAPLQSLNLGAEPSP